MNRVDRSISPLDFVYTNIIGTVNLLNTAKNIGKISGKLFIIFQLMRYLGVLVKKAFLRTTAMP
jgi:dTDP-glucose 4,6-dehydratase